jgi:filamentous hemagglutinin
MAVTRIKNNQILDSGIWANSKIIPGSITGALLSSNITVTSDFVITGNLYVTGATSTLTVASTNTYINDPLIVLNNAFSGTNGYDLGFVFERGSLVNQAFYWDESSDAFKLIATTETGDTYGAISAESSYSDLLLGNVTAQYDVDAKNATLTNNLTVAGYTNLAGNVSSPIVNAGALNATGTTTLAATNVSGFLNSSGNISAAIINGGAINSTGLINTTGNVSGAVVNAGALNATGTTTLATVNVSGFLNSSANVSAAIMNTGALNATGTSTLGAVNASGYVNLAGNISAATGHFGTLSVGGYTNLAGNVSSPVVNAGALNTTGTTTLAATNVSGFLNSSGNISAAILKGGAINSTGLINTTGNVSAAQVNAGQLNTTGNVSASQASVATVKASGLRTGRVVTTSTAGLMVDNDGLRFASNTLTVGAKITANAAGWIGTTSGDLVLAATDDVDFNGSNAINLADPSSAQDAVTKAYLETQLSSAVTTLIADDTFVKITDAGANGNIVIDVDADRVGLVTQDTTQVLNNLNVSNATVATSTTTGAIKTAGGIGVVGNVVAGGQFKSTADWESASVATGAIITAGGAGIAKNLNVGGDVTITGDLTVNGTETTLNTATLAVEDLQVTVADGAGSSAAADGAGINVDGVAVGANITYTHSTTSWNLNRTTIIDATAEATDVGEGALQVNGGASIDGRLYVGSGLQGTVIGNVTAAAASFTTVNASGFVNLAGNVSAAVVNGGALNVTGTTTLAATNVSGFLNASANISAPILNGGAINSTGLINTTGNVSGAIVNTGALNATGTTTLAATNVSGFLNSSGNISAAILKGGAINSTGLINTTGNISGAVVNTGALTATGTTTLAATNVSGFLNSSANVSAAVMNTGALNATGTSTLGAVNASGYVNLAGNISSPVVNAGALNATGTTTLGAVNASGYVNLAGNISASNAHFATLSASGYVNLAGNISAAVVHGGAINSTGLINTTGNVSGAVVNAGALNATGTTTLAATNVSGFLNSSGNISAAIVNTGALNATGIATVSNATEASAVDTGAIVTPGGVALAKSVFAGIGGTFNSTKVATSFLVKGQGNDQLFKIDTAKNAAVMSTNGNAIVQDGTIMKFDSTGAIILPIGANGNRPGATGNVAVAGMLRYNTTQTNMEFYNGTEWKQPGTEFTVIAADDFNGDGSTVAFTLDASSTTAATVVSINGIVQIPTTAYAVSGTTLTFTEAPAAGDVIDARRLTTTTTVNSLANGNSSVELQANDNNFANIKTGSTTRLSVNAAGDVVIEKDLTVKGELTVLGDSAGNINIGDQSTDKVQLTGTIVYDETAITTQAGNMVIIDSFSTAAYHSAKYYIQVRDGATSSIQTQETMLAQDDGAVNHTSYAVVAPDGEIGTFVSNISGGSARLIMVPVGAGINANIKAQTTYIV